MIHKRKLRIENIDNIKFSKTVIVDVGLDRKKEWELTVKDLGLQSNDNMISIATKKIKEQLRQLHKDYLEDKLEDNLKAVYYEYVKPYSLRSPNSQIENIKKRREENNKNKNGSKEE